MNGTSNFNLAPSTPTGIPAQFTNEAFIITTAASGDATTGDGDLDVVVYYTIENENP